MTRYMLCACVFGGGRGGGEDLSHYTALNSGEDANRLDTYTDMLGIED